MRAKEERDHPEGVRQTLRQTLRQLLRPAGGGVHVVSTGLEEQRALQRALYGERPEEGWEAALSDLEGARALILGVPSDAGAGFVRGANRAPLELRRWLLARPGHPAHAEGVIDVGDVRVVPHLLSEEMIGEDQRARCRAALYGDPASPLPVSPLGITARALQILGELAPEAVPILIGGDHSVAWPAFSAACDRAEARGLRLGLLHFDAHTDLLEERLGVRYCFATWAYHANERLGRDGRLAQVGVRISGRSQAHWEQTLGVRQIWAEEALRRGPEALAEEIGARFAERGVTHLYVSNDIDGTDPEEAGATGTPEPGGLSEALVRELSRRLAARFPLFGADLVEVAPPLAWGAPEEPERTLAVAGAYLGDLIEAALDRSPTTEDEP